MVCRIHHAGHFGAGAVLAIYLLAYAGDALSRMERLRSVGCVVVDHAMPRICCWPADCVCCLLAGRIRTEAPLGNCRAGDFKLWAGRSLLSPHGVAAAVYGLLYGTLRSTAAPPILMARVIATSGRWYLSSIVQVHWLFAIIAEPSADPTLALGIRCSL